MLDWIPEQKKDISGKIGEIQVKQFVVLCANVNLLF